jgi:S1-C subfamily serine protease
MSEAVAEGQALRDLVRRRSKGFDMRVSRQTRPMTAATFGLALFLVSARPAQAQQTAAGLGALQQLNGSVAALVARVSQSVVQVIVTSYGPVDEQVRTDTNLVIGRQRSIGSGVVVDAGGYIITNAHVVSNARRVEVVLLLQTITPTLAAGLNLAQDWGAMISDVLPDSPAAKAGFEAQDIVLSIDGDAVDGLPRLAFQLLTRSAGDVVRLKVRRGADLYTADVTVTEQPHDFDRLTDLVDPQKSLIATLGVLGVDITEANAMASSLRAPTGVLVVGQTKDEGESADTGLQTGDAIHGINGKPITSVDNLRAALDVLGPRHPVVLQIERNGQFIFLAFEANE